MPKNALGRRHRRQSNLTLLASESPISRTAVRKVSDEDITGGSSDSGRKSLSDSADSSCGPTLKRRSSTTCALFLASAPQHELPTPTTNAEFVESFETGSSPSSPWGHFVELFVNDDQPPRADTDKSLPTLDATMASYAANRIVTDPYCLTKRRRMVQARSSASQRAVPRFILGGKFLPRRLSSSDEADSDYLPEALMKLSF
jgi:hypothetical protein